MRYKLDGWKLIEVGPDACPQGHPLVPYSHTVSWDGSYRTYTCQQCWQENTRRRRAGEPELQDTLRYVLGWRPGTEIEWKNKPEGDWPWMSNGSYY